MKKLPQEEVWNEISKLWSGYRKRTPEEISEFLNGKKGKILDLGCGSGRNIVASPDVEYYGVDFSIEMLKFAEKRAKEIGAKALFFKEDLFDLPFEGNFFDAAIFISTLHCIETSENRKKSLEELYRVLKKDGEAMISVWDREKGEKLRDIPEKEGYVSWRMDGVYYPRYYYFYEQKELKELLEKIGFKILRTEKKDSETLIGRHARKNIIFFVQKK